MKPKEKKCDFDECGKMFIPRYKSTEKHCSSKCYYSDLKSKPQTEKKKNVPIRQFSAKRAKESREYKKLWNIFMAKDENKICPVTGYRTTEVHHKMGRTGYADDWARENEISLYLDIRFWLAVHTDGHKKIELNPEWAKEMGYSLNRL